jgi:hypothetical protein
LATSAEHNGGCLKHASTLEIRQDSAKKPYSSLLFQHDGAKVSLAQAPGEVATTGAHPNHDDIGV